MRETLKNITAMTRGIAPLAIEGIKRKYSEVNWTSVLTATAAGVLLVMLIDYVTGIRWLAELVFVFMTLALAVVFIAYGENLFPDYFIRKANIDPDEDIDEDPRDKGKDYIVPAVETEDRFRRE